MVRLRRSVARRPKSKDGQKRAHLIIQGGTMSRKWLLFLFCLSLLMVLAPLSRAGLTLRVKESAIRVLFEEQGTRVVLPIENSLSQRVDTHLKLEIIDRLRVDAARVHEQHLMLLLAKHARAV